MSAKKKKNDEQIDRGYFLLSWTMHMIFVYPIAIMAGLAILSIPAGTFLLIFVSIAALLQDSIPTIAVNMFVLVLIAHIGAAVAYSISAIQSGLLRRYFSWQAQDWDAYSVIGGAIGAVMALEAGKQSLIYVLPVFAGLISLLQYFSLRRVVHHAWLWVMPNVIGAALLNQFVIFLTDNQDELIGTIAGMSVMLIYGISSGLLLLWLFKHHRHTKPDFIHKQPT